MQADTQADSADAASVRSKAHADQTRSDTHARDVSVAPSLSSERIDHQAHDSQARIVDAAPTISETKLGGDRGHIRNETHIEPAKIIAEIRETHRRRQDFIRAETKLTLQIKAIQCRMCREDILKQLPRALHALKLDGYDAPTIKRAISELKKFKLIEIDGKDFFRKATAIDRSLPIHAASSPSDPLNASADDHRRTDTHDHRVAADASLNASESDLPWCDTHSFGVDSDASSFGEDDDQSLYADDTHEDRASSSFFAVFPFAEARKILKAQRMKEQKRMEQLAAQLAVASFVNSINGFGFLGLAQIVGEAGDLSMYANPAKLWKRMGLAVFNGKSQRKVAGVGALEQGYSPTRRSIMFVIGDSLLKAKNGYKDLYDSRKVLEQSKVPDGTKMLWHRRAHRYAEKRLLRNLWQTWHGQA